MHMDLDIQACDRARLARDPRFDGRFFTSVVHFAKKLIDETDLRMAQLALAAGFGSRYRNN